MKMFDNKRLNVKIRFQLKDRMDNKFILNIGTTDFGNLTYCLSGKGGTPYALSNMIGRHSRDLPATVDDYAEFKDLMCDLIGRVDSSNYEVDVIVFQKYKIVEQDYVLGHK
jgi:hypothetical protein